MRLEDIGFYTLSDERCENASDKSRLMRCELILTDMCNFKCPYCRGLRSDCKGTMNLERAKEIVDYWTKDNLKSIRLSGGEPTVWKELVELVEYIKVKGVENIAISTNGYASFELYERLIKAGVNDFSISLDACCSDFGDKMSGGVKGSWAKVIENIKKIAQFTYVTLGCVVTEDTVSELSDTINFASSLGVADIRIISSAQYNTLLENAKTVDKKVWEKYPILKYRMTNINNNRNVRGLKELDSHKCGLVLDDMAIAGSYHFPCIIYMREGGDPIGNVSDNMREERKAWSEKHDTHCDKICKNNCLDVCIDYNNKYNRFQIRKQTNVTKLDSSLFTWDLWSAGSIHDFGIEHFRYNNLNEHKDKLYNGIIGYCFAEELVCRPKESHIALMYEKEDGERFWFHIRNSEFVEIFK